MDKIYSISQDCLRKEALIFGIGDTVRVNVAIHDESNKTRIQGFEGVVIAKNGSGITETFTVRKISYGVGVERIFPVNSPKIESVKVLFKGKVRRSKLYYLRTRVGKAARIKRNLSAN
ncbi:MAG: 50S ribosomal protein L19 [Candidatus Improbicoccus devescovinae]|nr:MAG: 50S ribosomal protein L19 [Candidatus Improbicoccus devescovinae]